MILKTLYVNGMIFTSNDEMPYATAMSVSLGGIDYVGTTQGLMESLGLSGLYDPKISEYEVIDLKGRTVIPGFVDADIRERAFNGNELAEKGIVGTSAQGALGDDDVFENYLNATKQGLMQSVSLYYPWEFIKAHPETLSDKQRQIRSRKVHVAGIELKGEMQTTEETYEEALAYCKENGLQLSIEVTDEDPATNMLQIVMQEPTWFEDINIPCCRVHRGESDFEPFKSIKSDLIAEIEAANSATEKDENAFYGLDSIVIGYTKLAAEYSGMYGIGEIKVGNQATFLILNRDLSKIPVEELDTVKPEVTIIDGQIAYKEEGSEFKLSDKHAGSDGLSSGIKLAAE